MVFGAYLVALVLLLATDLDQRLLPDVITLPAIPLAFVVRLSGLNPLVPPGVLPIAIVVAIAVPLAALAWSRSRSARGRSGRATSSCSCRWGCWSGRCAWSRASSTGRCWRASSSSCCSLLRRITLKTFIPFGPFLIIGAIWAILVIT